MTDEPTAEPTVSEDTTTEEVAAPEESAEEPIDWEALDAALEKAYGKDPKTASDRLKKHRAIGGIAGSIAERRVSELWQRQEAEQRARAQQAAHEDLRKMAQERPLEFADTFLSHDDAEQARQRISNVEFNAKRQIMEQIGAAYHRLDEWKEITPEERQRLEQAVNDGPPEDALARFNVVATDIVADRRSEKRLADRLAKEKEAWQKQWEAERLTSEEGPDLRQPSSVARKRVNWSAMNDQDFEKFWRDKQKRLGLG